MNCSESDTGGTPDGSDQVLTEKVWSWSQLGELPKGLSNNPVAGIEENGECRVISAGGIEAPYSRGDIFSDGFLWSSSSDTWEATTPLPGPPRLAANGVSVGGAFYVLGGYSVGVLSETSHDLVFRYDEVADVWEERTPLPTPVDDALVDVWQDRYIVVVSGWSNVANITDVQIYDSQTDEWSLGTPFPGVPVFGQTGAIAGDTILLVDGASSEQGFPIVRQRWIGELDPGDFGTIAWTEMNSSLGDATRYRAASSSVDDTTIVITGGTSTPYNFDGLRYDNDEQAFPIEESLVFDVDSKQFTFLPVERDNPTMDHRSFAKCGSRLLIPGGMVSGLSQSAELWVLDFKEE